MSVWNKASNSLDSSPHTIPWGKQSTSIVFTPLVNCCSFLLQHPSLTLVNIAPFRQTWKSLSSPSQIPSNSGGKPLQILDVSTRQENEVILHYYKGFTLFGVPEQLGIFTKYEMTLFNFFHTTFRSGKQSDTFLIL